MNKTILVLTVCVSLIFGCQKYFREPDFSVPLSCNNVEYFYQSLSAYTPRSFSYTGELEIKNKETQSSFQIFVYLGEPKKIRLDIHSEFSLLLSTIIFDGDKIYAYLQDRGEMHIGKLSQENIFRLLGINIQPSLVIDLLALSFSSWVTNVNECRETIAQLVVRKGLDPTNFTITIDAKSKNIESIIIEQGPWQSVQIAFKTIQNKFEFNFPTTIEITDEQFSQRLKVTISKIEYKKPMSKELFRPSFRSGIKIIHMDDA